MSTKFHMKVADLRESHARLPAKEMLIVRVLRVREGMAGRTPKWECDLIDDNSSQSVLLADLWAGNIEHAKAHLQEGKVYKITNYLITHQGKSLTSGKQHHQARRHYENWYRPCGRGPSEYPSPPSSGEPRWHLRLESDPGGFARSRGRLARCF